MAASPENQEVVYLQDLLPEYEAWLVGRGRRPRGVYDYVREAKRLIAWLQGNPTPLDLTDDRLTTYRDELASRYKISSVHATLCSVRAFCKFLVRKKFLTSDPTREMDFPHVPPSAPRALTRLQIRELLDAIEQPPTEREWEENWERNRLTVLLMLYTGLRLSEATALLWADVQLDTRTITVRSGKGGRSRSVPIHQRLLEQLRRVENREPERAVLGNRNGDNLHPKTVAEVFSRWLRARGLSLTAHQLRHTFATELLRSGAPLRDIQAMLGHASLETTQIYLLVDAAHLQKSVDLLPNY